jgi:hypothetical protein
MSLEPFTVTTSITNWLKICDALEEHAEMQRENDTGKAKPGWEMGQQFADQIREQIAVEPWDEGAA